MSCDTREYRPWRTVENFDEAEMLQWRLAVMRHQIDVTEVTMGAYGPVSPVRAMLGPAAPNGDAPMQQLLEAIAQLRIEESVPQAA